MLKRPDGINISFTTRGSGIPLIVINDLMPTKESCDRLAQRLDDHGFAVTTYDLRHQGVGQSILCSLETFDTHVDDFLALMDYLGYESATIVGFSYGAEVAQRFAMRFPRRVNRLVLAAANCPALANRYAMIFRSWLRALPEMQAGDWVPYARAVCPWSFGASYLLDKPSFLEDYASHVSKTQSRNGLEKNLNLIIAAFDDMNSLRLSEMRNEAPCLFISGEDDYITPPLYFSQTLKSYPYATTQVLKKCGHAVWIEAPDTFCNAVLEFTAQQEM